MPNMLVSTKKNHNDTRSTLPILKALDPPTGAIHLSYNDPRATTREDLLGCTAISYGRYSNSIQQPGSTLERQDGICQNILDHFGMTCDHSVIDEGVPASNGRHRKVGGLSDILKLLREGKIPRGTPIIVEAMDRLVREPMTISLKLLTEMVDRGLIIITGDMTIWDQVTINSWLNIKLVAEINAAYEYVKRLRDMQRGVHVRQRDRLTKISNGTPGPKPIMNRTPGWTVRIGDRLDPASIDYQVIDQHAQTVKMIYALCLQGMTVRQIAIWLNARLTEYPTFGWRVKIWTASRVGYLLQDDHVLGYVRPKIGKRQETDIKAKLLPEVIKRGTFEQVRAIMDGRRDRLRGPRGKRIANLFTGKVFCQTCKGAMRVSTGPRIRTDGTRRHDLVCGQYTDNESCHDRTKYDLSHYEPELLTALIKLSTLVPRGEKQADQQLSDTLAALRSEIADKAERAEALTNARSQSPTTAGRIARLDEDADALRRKADSIEAQIAAIPAHGSRWAEVWAFTRRHMVALPDDIAKREQLRAMLAPIDFAITGTPMGGLLLTVGRHEEHIEPPQPRERKPHRPASATAKAKVYAKRKFLRAARRTEGGLALRIRLTKGEQEPAIGASMETPQGTRYYTGNGWWNIVSPADVAEPIILRIAKPRGTPDPQRDEQRIIDGHPMYYKSRGWWSTILGT